MAQYSTRRQFATPDGVVIVGDTSGDPAAPAVVLMHGGGQTRHSWSGAQDSLADAGYYVINYDARGHGDSDWSSAGAYDPASHVRDLRGVLAHVSTPVALVGASMGGITAMQAIADGFRPSALVLVDIVLRPEPVGLARILKFMRANPNGFASLDEAADAVAVYNPERARPKDPGNLSRNLRLAADGRLHWHWDPRIIPPTLAADLAAMEELLAGMRLAPPPPTLLIRGARSDVVSEAAISEFRSLLPALEVFEVAAAGHMVAGDSNDIFNRAVLDFLDRHRPAAA